MNKWIGMGRLTADAKITYTQDGTAVARFNVAIDRYKDGTDYPSCVAFGKTAEFLEKYGKKGVKFLVEGRIQTGSYEKDGHKVYTTDVIAEYMEFAESKNTSSQPADSEPKTDADGFMNIPANIDEELPFN